MADIDVQALLDHHNSITRRGAARANQLEAQMTRLLIPVFDKAADEAVEKFKALAAMRTVVGGALDVPKTSTMICLKPTAEQAAALAQDGGEEPDNLHCTLCFLGDYPGSLTDIQEALHQVAATHAPLEGEVGGTAAFSDNGQGVPSIVLPDVPGLAELRVDVTKALAAKGIDYSRQHGFTPHMTLGYGMGTPPQSTLGQALNFDHLRVVRGNDEEVAVPLTGVKPITAAADPPPLPAGPVKPVICVDLDGTINDASLPFSSGTISPVLPGAAAWLAEVAQSCQVVIFTARDDHSSVAAWLNQNGFALIPWTITNVKPQAALWYFDDRAWRANGVVSEYPSGQDFVNAQPWWRANRPKDFSQPTLEGTSVDELAQSVRAQAESHERPVTDAITRHTRQVGGVMSGLNERLKSQSSIAGKIELSSDQEGISVQKAASDIKDALRFTAVFSTEDYTDGVLATLDRLNAAGLTTTRLRNYWIDNEGDSRYAEGTYLGINTVLQCLDGYRCELQFHTPQSQQVQEANTADYHALRSGSLDEQDKADTIAGMQADNEFIPVPDGAESILPMEFSLVSCLPALPFLPDASDPLPHISVERIASKMDRSTFAIPASAHYRPATDKATACETCSYFAAGTNFHCGMFDTPVSPTYTCDEWSKGLSKPLPPHEHSFVAAGEPPNWTQPSATDLVDVDKLVAELRAVMDPVAQKVTLIVMQTAVETAPVPAQEPRSQGEPGDTVSVVAATKNPASDVGIAFDVTNPLVQQTAAAAGSHIQGIAETTRTKVAASIADSYNQGLSIDDAAASLQATMKGLSSSRAQTIARTELAGAVNGGSLASTQIVDNALGGLNISKQWLTSPGAIYPRHETYDGLDGQTVSLYDLFSVGDDQLQFPGDPSGDPSEVCNCRCSISYVENGQVIAEGSADDALDPDAVASEAESGDGSGLITAGDVVAIGDDGAVAEAAPIEMPDDLAPVETAAVVTADQADLSLLDKPWRDPPPAKGVNVGKGGAGGYTSDAASTTLTETGRIGEQAFQRLTGGQILHAPGKGELSPLDVAWDHRGFEVKAVWTDSSRFAAWPKPYEQAQKEAAAQAMGVTSSMSIVVLDRDSNTAFVYYRDGLKGGRLSKRTGWRFMGTTDLTNSEAASADRMAAAETKAGSLEAIDTPLTKVAENPTAQDVITAGDVEKIPHPSMSADDYANPITNGPAKATLDKLFRGWAAGLTRDETTALNQYGDEAYRSINGYLRQGRYREGSAYSEQQIKKMVKGLDEALDSGPATKMAMDMKVYRGVYDVRKVLSAPKIGDVFNEKGFMSTTTDENIAYRFGGSQTKGGLFEIIVPRGTSGAWMPARSGWGGGEAEFLLKRNMNYRVTKVYDKEVRDYGRTRTVQVVQMRLEPPAGEIAPAPVAKPVVKSVADDDYARPITDGPAADHFNDLYKGWGASLNPDQSSALGEYANFTYQPINEYLRTGKYDAAYKADYPLTTAIEDIKSIDEAIASAPPLDTAAEVKVFRGVSKVKQIFGSYVPKIGDTIVEPGFLSTTTDEAVAVGEATGRTSALMEIIVPKGTSAAWMPSVDEPGILKTEQELLLRRSSELQVVGTRFEVIDGTKYRVVTMRLLPPEAPEPAITAQDLPTTKKLTVLPEPTEARPYGHLKTAGLDRRIEVTRKSMREALTRPGGMTTLEAHKYPEWEANLKAALRERDLRAGIGPDRPYAHLTEQNLRALFYKTEKQVKDTARKEDRAPFEATLADVKKELRIRSEQATPFPSKGAVARGEKEPGAKTQTRGVVQPTQPKTKPAPPPLPNAEPPKEITIPPPPTGKAAQQGVIKSIGRNPEFEIVKRPSGNGWQINGSYKDKQTGKTVTWTSGRFKNKAAAEKAVGLHKLGYSPVVQKEYVLGNLPNSIETLAAKGRDNGLFDPARQTQADVLNILKRAQAEGTVVQDENLWRPTPPKELMPESKRAPYKPPVPAKNGRMARLQQAYESRYNQYRDTEQYGTIVVGSAPTPEYNATVALGNDFRNEVTARLKSVKAPEFTGTKAQKLAAKTAWQAQSERDMILQVLSEIRPLSTTDALNGISINSDAASTQLLRNAAKVYPSDWNDLLGNMRIDITQTPGSSGVTYFTDDRRFVVQLNNDAQGPAHYQSYLGERVSIHELGHVFEQVVDGLPELERQWYTDRTYGEPLKLAEGTTNVFYREDEFINAYMGRDYYNKAPGSQQQPPAPVGGAAGARVFEILSMGMEALMTGSYSVLQDDPQMANFLLGVLTSL